MPEMDGTIMEISGLGQAPDAAKNTTGNWILAAVGTLIGGAIIYCLANKSLSREGAGLGMIKRCRKSDLKSGRGASGQRWCLWDSKGKRVLGRHPSRSKAERQERLIQARKHGAL